jgi:FAD/FMN-containing dehydrogenase
MRNLLDLRPSSGSPVSGLPAPPTRRPDVWLNDIHSQLNRTRVGEVVRPHSIPALQRAVGEAASRAIPVSVYGGRHAMGGQQFCTRGIAIDTSALNRIVDYDPDRGHITVEAGIGWPELVAHLTWVGADRGGAWGIRQKQTGADRMTIGGSVASNIHGRGLRMQPFIADIEEFHIVDPAGQLLRCSREHNRELFTLAVGGYGLFGPVATVTLRLAKRHKVQRRVTIANMDRLPELFETRISQGFEYGDFQFATDTYSREFLAAGVFSCYRPVDLDEPLVEPLFRLSERDWQRLILLAHTNKSRAFAEYARFYLSTDGQLYWSDTHQLAEYLDGYHADLDRQLASGTKGSEMISELYVPRHRLPAFMASVREDARRHAMDIVYGTVRVIERDDESVLAWARQPWACVVFNLHVDHTSAGVSKAADHFRRLIDRAIEQNGSYYLTYHRWATPDQIRRCHPRLPEFLARKRAYDPDGVFQSDWYRHHANLLEVTS